MRNVMRKIALMAAALMIMAVPVLADDTAVMPRMEQAEQGGKNDCLLVAMNCGQQVDSIQQRIDRIQHEIGRGTAVYTNEELRRLQDQLDEANRNFNELQTGA